MQTGVYYEKYIGQHNCCFCSTWKSYILAGEGTALGVSYATDPGKSSDWVKEGPHLMVVVPDRAMLEGLSTGPNDPVYVMWKDTPYAHIMVKVAANQ